MADKASPLFVLIGRVAKAHGIYGDIVADLYAESPEILDHVGELYLRSEPAGSYPDEDTTDVEPPRHVRVHAWREHQGRALLSLKGLRDRNGADALRGSTIWVRADELPEPDEDDVFLYELDGLEVFTEDGARIGTVEDLMETGHSGQEVWVIRGDGGEEILFPAEPEFVLELDPDARRVVIAPPPGLLELYREPEDTAGKQPDADKPQDA